MILSAVVQTVRYILQRTPNSIHRKTNDFFPFSRQKVVTMKTVFDVCFGSTDVRTAGHNC